MDAPQAGSGELRSDEDALLGSEAPDIRIHVSFPFTHGGRFDGTAPCGKCGCEFVNVGCPKSWPINTVAITCAKCGSVVEYIDGLLLMTVKQALKEHVAGRTWAVNRRAAVPLAADSGTAISGFGAAKELVQMGIDGGLSDQDIAEVLECSEEYVALVAQTLR